MTTRNTQTTRIAMLSLSLDLYRKVIPDAIGKYESFHQELKAHLATLGSLVSEHFCFEREQVESAVREAVHQQADVLVVVLQSYSPSLVSLNALLRTDLPILIWNTQRLHEVGPDFSMNDMIENHGMHGVQDLCNCLRRSGRVFGLVSGHLNDPQHLDDLAQWLRIGHAVSFSRRLKVGLIGRPFQGMGDFGVDETRMLSDWGPSVEHITLSQLAESVSAVDEHRLKNEIDRDRSLFEFSEDINEDDHRCSARLSVALRDLVKSTGIDAVTMHFGVFGEDPRIETCPFLGFSALP